jgi:hypothetical protein
MVTHNNKHVIASTMEQSNVYKPLQHSNPLLASRFVGLDPESKEGLSPNLSGEAHHSCYPTKID